MSAPESPTYFRPPNSDTGEPTLLTYFTAMLCELAEAHLYDPDERIADFVADVRDHMDALGVPIRPTIKTGRIRIIHEDDPAKSDNWGYREVHATVMAFLTDAEPDDPRLVPLLANGFKSGRLNTKVTFTIPTTASEAELETRIAEEDARGAEFATRDASERAAVAVRQAKAAADPFGADDMDDLFD